MLTKKDRKDLLQDFKQVFATKNDLKSFATKDDLTNQLAPIKTDITAVKQDVTLIKKDLKSIKKDVKQIRIDVKSTLKYVDEQDKTLRFRTKRIEKHLGLPEIPYITT